MENEVLIGYTLATKAKKTENILCNMWCFPNFLASKMPVFYKK